MIYRLLGIASLAIGAIFLLVALLVLLPFLNNFNTSLLVLFAIFGIFAWVFIGIGWQLVHPPAPGEQQAEPTPDEARVEEDSSFRPPEGDSRALPDGNGSSGSDRLAVASLVSSERR